MTVLFNKLRIAAVILFSLVTFGNNHHTSAQTPDIQPLVLGKPIERDLKGDEFHSYTLALQAGQYVDLVVEQKGIDVVVTLFDPAGKKIAEVDSPNGTNGPEPLSLIVATPGSYRLEIRSLEKTAAVGLYEARILELRPSTPKDKSRVAAQKAFGEAGVLLQLGTRQSLSDAKEKYEESLRYFRECDDFLNQAEALNKIGGIYVKLDMLQLALDSYNNSLEVYRRVGNKGREGRSLTNIGFIYSSMGDKRQALKFYSEALPLQQAVGDKIGEAYTLINIGSTYNDLGDNVQALKFFNDSLPLLRQMNDKVAEGTVINNIAGVYNDLGDTQSALRLFNQALVLRREIGDKRAEATTLSNIGSVYDYLGEKQLAIKYLNESLVLRRAVGDRRGEATSLNNIALAYYRLAERQQALKFYREAEPVFHEIGDKRGEAYVSMNIGLVLYDLKQIPQAIKLYTDALVLFREIGNKIGEANVLDNLGPAYMSLSETGKAIEMFEKALELQRTIGDKPGEADTLNGIGLAYSALGQKAMARQSISLALPLRKVVSDKRGEARTLGSLFYILRTSDTPRFTTFVGKSAINSFQILRDNATGLDKNIQQTYLNSIEGIYRDLATDLIRQGRLSEAQQVLNLFKNQQYFDFKSKKQTAPLTLTPREATVAARLDEMIGAVVAAIRAVDDFKRSIGSRPPAVDELAQIKSLEVKRAAANDDYSAFLKQAEKEFAAPPDEMDKVPDIVDVKAMQNALRSTSATTKQKAVAVYTLVGEDGFKTLLITPDTITSAVYQIKGKDLNDKALQFWKLLRTPKYDPQPAANELYKIVFEPLRDKLPKDTKTILWSLDGNLRYVPVATLFDGKHYLVERYQNVVFTRADKEQMTKNASDVLSGTGLGSSEAHKVILGDDTFNAAALPSVKTELGRIFKQGNSGVLKGDVLLDERFTKAAMLDAMKTHRPLVHIASHFLFEPGDEARSFLLLGDGTPFTLDEMKSQKDLFAGVDLLTLSACQTAAQRPDANGREVDGFAELAQRLGAGAVMASLWEVSDDSTAELMSRFYQNYAKAGSNKANSIRKAQLSLLKGDYNAAGSADRQLTQNEKDAESIKIDPVKLIPYKRRKDAPFSHPYYWSPFILIGNWK